MKKPGQKMNAGTRRGLARPSPRQGFIFRRCHLFTCPKPLPNQGASPIYLPLNMHLSCTPCTWRDIGAYS